jgi:hypothetical protein
MIAIELKPYYSVQAYFSPRHLRMLPTGILLYDIDSRHKTSGVTRGAILVVYTQLLEDIDLMELRSLVAEC